MTLADGDAAYQSAIGYLSGRVNYERTPRRGPAEEVFKLDRMRHLLRALGDPHEELPAVHIAGTKGKGSTASMVASCLTAAGYRVGKYTSPHLNTIEERFCVDTEMMTPSELVAIVERLQAAVAQLERRNAHDLSPTYFELTTAMAFLQFARRGVDIAVLEVGLGGRLDSTNVCRPEVSLITSISYDHTDQLGSTLASIAGEKAGIIKPGVPVCSGATAAEADDVIAQVARERGSPLRQLGRDFTLEVVDQHGDPGAGPAAQPNADHILPWTTLDFSANGFGEDATLQGLQVRMPGRHQADNAVVAVAGLLSLNELGWRIPEAAIRTGLAAAACPARVEYLSRRPAVVLDSAHNVASVDALIAALDESPTAGQRTVVFAATRDKDLEGMVARLVASFDRLVFTRYASNPRAASPDLLAEIAIRQGATTADVTEFPATAWNAAVAGIREADLLCVTGSFFVAGEIRALLGRGEISMPLGAEPASGIAR